MSTEFQWTDETVKEFVTDLLRNGFYNIPKHLVDYKASKQPKPVLFTTEDGVPLHEGDKHWYVRTDFEIEEYIATASWTSPVRCFSTKEKAEEYCLYNRPLLSLREVLPSIGIGYDEEIIQKAKDKLNHQ